MTPRPVFHVRDAATKAGPRPRALAVSGDAPETMVSWDAAPAAAFPPGAVIVVYSDTLDSAAATYTAALRRSFADATIVLRCDHMSIDSPAAWLSANGVSVAPNDIANPLTLDAYVEAALERTLVPRRLADAAPVTAREPLADFLNEISADMMREPGVVLLVLALPRTGSKQLADQLVGWAAPHARVLHAHDITAKRAQTLDNSEATEAERARQAFKRARFDELQAQLAQARRLVVFLTERDPIDRIMSVFTMNNLDLVRAYWAGERARGDVQQALDKAARGEFKRVSKWYVEQFAPFGVDLAAQTFPPASHAIVRGGRADLAVLHSAGRAALLTACGLDDPLVGKNSAEERGFGALRARMAEEFRIDRGVEDNIRALPAIRALHPGG